MKENSIEEIIKQLELILKVRKEQKEIIECADGSCINCDPDIRALTECIDILSDYKRVLKENKLLRKDIEGWKKYCEEIREEQTEMSNKNCELEFKVEKLQKENEKLKNQEAAARKINELLVQRYSNSISLQKVKDKIRHYQELQDNYIKKYDEINEGLQAMINVLQELLEGKNKMCEYCKLFSGDRITLAEDGETEIKIERHNKEYSLVAEGLTDIAETRINYCPMCGRELKED